MIKFEVGKEYLVDWEIELGRFDDETICVARTEDTVTFRYDDPYWKRTFFLYTSYNPFRWLRSRNAP